MQVKVLNEGEALGYSLEDTYVSTSAIQLGFPIAALVLKYLSALIFMVEAESQIKSKSQVRMESSKTRQTRWE